MSFLPEGWVENREELDPDEGKVVVGREEIGWTTVGLEEIQYASTACQKRKDEVEGIISDREFGGVPDTQHFERMRDVLEGAYSKLQQIGDVFDDYYNDQYPPERRRR